MILGITGTLGAGKTTVASYLETKGFTYRSVRSFIITEVHRRNLPLSRDALVEIGNEIRAEHGPDYIIKTLIADAITSGGDMVIESIRAVAEAELLLRQGGHLIAVDAHQIMRYERIMESTNQVMPVSLVEFQAQEAREMHSSEINKQSIADVMALAEFTINNTGSTTDLCQAIDVIVATIRQKK